MGRGFPFRKVTLVSRDKLGRPAGQMERAVGETRYRCQCELDRINTYQVRKKTQEAE